MATLPGHAAPPQTDVVLSHLDSLPTLAPVAVQLLRATSNPDSGAADLARLLRGDQSLAARLLSIANAAASGTRGKITSLDQAVVLLGFTLVRNIVLAVKIFECFHEPAGPGPQRSFQRTEFWKHALAVACAARRLAESAPELRIDREEAFLAGLLHDLGKVALDAVFPKGYERAVEQSVRSRGDISDHERAVLGIDHATAGRHLAQAWNLPDTLRDVIWLHHAAIDALPSQVSQPKLVGLVQLADTLVREQRIGFSGNLQIDRGSSLIAENLGVSENALASTAAALVADVAEQASLLGLDRETPEALYLKSLTRANGELSQLNTQLVSSNRRLAVSARCFAALTELDRLLTPRADLADVVVALARAGRVALDCPVAVAFAAYERAPALEVAWHATAETPADGAATERMDPDLQRWFAAPARGNEILWQLPPEIRAGVATPLEHLPDATRWLLPIVQDGGLLGGVVFAASEEACYELTAAADQLQSLVRSFGLAIQRTHAHAAAQRLSDDLAESNRRLQSVQSELLRTRTLSMIAEMATGAGHELNSPLAVISGRAQMLLESTEDESLRRSLEVIHAKAHECSQVVNELMDFARPPTPKRDPVPLSVLFDEAREGWLRESGMPTSRLVMPTRQPGEPNVLVDRGQMAIVLRELLRNATLAITGNDGIIEVSWRWAEPPAAAEPDRPVEIAIRDNGSGMSPAVKQRAFDPFFSHRPAGRGRGLGLARAGRIIDAHGGRLWLESQPGEGTTVRLVLQAEA